MDTDGEPIVLDGYFDFRMFQAPPTKFESAYR